MPTASGIRSRIVYVAESTIGVTPGSPQTKILRTTSRNINLKKNMLPSDEVRTNRLIKDLRHGFNSVEASFGFELGIGSYDDQLEGIMANTWATVGTQGSPNLGATATGTFTRATGSWVTDGIRPGDIITTAGFSNGANNGVFRVLTVAATTLTVDSVAVLTEAQGAAKTLVVTGKRLDIGTTLKTFAFERQYLDIAQYEVFNGMAHQNFDMRVEPEKIVTCTMGMLGMSAVAPSGTPLTVTPTAASTNAPFSSFDGALYEGATVIGIVTAITLGINNNRTLQPIVGSKISESIYEGRAMAPGQLSVLFQSATMLNKFRNETTSSLWLRLNDLNGVDFHNLVMPAIKYTAGNIDPPQEGPCILTLPYQALEDANGNCLSWQRSN